MPKKKNSDPIKKRLQKIRSALRLVWSRDFSRKAIITEALDENKTFLCVLCGKRWEAWAADVDHEPPLGSIPSLEDVGDWVVRLFNGPRRPICKPCHKKKTAQDRKKAA